MLRRRLRLEFLEDRALPSGLSPADDPPLPAVLTPGTPADSAPDPDAAEYKQRATDKPPADTDPDEPSEYAPDHQSDAAATGDPRTVPASDSGKTASTDAATPTYRRPTDSYSSDAAEYATPVLSVVALPAPTTADKPAAATLPPPPPVVAPSDPTAGSIPVSTGLTVAPPAPLGPSLTAAPPPSDNRPDPVGDPAPVEPIAPDAGPVERDVETPPPAEQEPGESPLSSAANLGRLVDELAVRVDLPAGWDRAAARLLGGLAATAGDPSGSGSRWVRLGYLALTTAAVGVAVELCRQVIQARRPEPEPGTLPFLRVKKR